MRDDLNLYLNLIDQKKANAVLDIGSGTGCLAVLLAEKGLDVTGLEPAKASVEKAKTKPHADKIDWVVGDIKALHKHDKQFDMAVMTGNVAQVFLEDDDWQETLDDVATVLKAGGFFVFETRDPAKKAWKSWTKENTHCVKDIPGIGDVEAWCEVVNVEGEKVSFIWHYHFKKTDEYYQSQSTLRFRSQEAISHSLTQAGFTIEAILDAPDRPGKEFVFVAHL